VGAVKIIAIAILIVIAVAIVSVAVGFFALLGEIENLPEQLPPPTASEFGLESLDASYLEQIALSGVSYQDLLQNNDQYWNEVVRYQGEVTETVLLGDGMYQLTVDAGNDEIFVMNTAASMLPDVSTAPGYVDFYGMIIGADRQEELDGTFSGVVNIAALNFISVEPRT
jgi:hypothetical protein